MTRPPTRGTTSRASDAAAATPRRTGLLRIPQAQWVLVSMIAGVAIGCLSPDRIEAKAFHATDLQVLSTVFLRSIKSVIAPLLFATLVVGIAGHGDDVKRADKLAFRSILSTSRPSRRLRSSSPWRPATRRSRSSCSPSSARSRSPTCGGARLR